MRTRRVVLAAALAAVVGLMAPAPGALASGTSFPSRISLPHGFAPEGLASGPGTTFYTGSLVNGAIYRGDLRTGRGVVVARGRKGRVAVGMDLERGAGRLWVAGGPTGTVRVHNARTGNVLKTYHVDAGFLNDVVVTRRAVYVTDSAVQQLVVIPLRRDGALPDRGTVKTVPLVGDLVYQDGFNANGAVSISDGRRLLVVTTNTGRLFRVNPFTGATHRVFLHGASLTTGDGLERRGHQLYVVRNGVNRVVVLRLGPQFRSGRRIGSIASPQLDVPTSATFAAGRLFAVNARFNTPVTPRTRYWVTRLPGS